VERRPSLALERRAGSHLLQCFWLKNSGSNVELVRQLTGTNENRSAGGPNETHHNADNKVEFAMRLTLHLLAAAAFAAVLATACVAPTVVDDPGATVVSQAQSGTATGDHEPSSTPGKGTAVSPEPGTSDSKQTTNVKSKRADPSEPAFGSKEFWDSDAASQGK
jgi:hypothetical protein